MKNKNSRKYLKILSILGVPILITTAIATPIYISSLSNNLQNDFLLANVDFTFSNKSKNNIESILIKNDVESFRFAKTSVDYDLIEKISGAIEINDNFLLSEIRKFGKEDSLKLEISELIINEYNNEKIENNNLRHGSIFKGHFWDAAYYHSIAACVWTLLYLNAIGQSAVVVANFVAALQTYDMGPTAEAMAGFDLYHHWLADISKRKITKVFIFKKNTNCHSTFWVGPVRI